MTRPQLPTAVAAKAGVTAVSAALILVLAAGCRPTTTTTTTTAPPADRQTNTAAAPQSSFAPSANDAPPANGESPLPARAGFVNDYAKVLDEAALSRLEDKLRLLRVRGQVEFAVATVETTGGRGIDDYSLALARGWGIGSKETGDGLLLLLAVKDRQWRVQVSRSLEPSLPNAEVAEICRSAAPLYRAGRHGEGVVKCVDGLTARLVEKKRFQLEE